MNFVSRNLRLSENFEFKLFLKFHITLTISVCCLLVINHEIVNNNSELEKCQSVILKKDEDEENYIFA